MDESDMQDDMFSDSDRRRALKAFVEAQNAAVLEVADQGLLTLTSLISSGAIDISPNFQRRDRWNPDKQARLIESFLSNIPVPPVYLSEDSEVLGSYAVIDGKQRLTSIAAFFSDNLLLRGLTRLPLLNGLSYSQLPVGIRNPLGMKSLRVTTLLRQSDPALKHEVFLRLNTGGEVLNAQEIRNVAYRGPTNDLVYELAENRFLRRQLKVVPPSSSAYRQMADAEYVLRFLTLAQTWREFRGDLRGAFDLFMQKNRFPSSDTLENYRHKFTSSITSAEAIWREWAFKRPGRDQTLAGLYDAQMVALAELDRATHEVLIRKRDTVVSETNSLFEDAHFDEAVRIGTNTPARLRERITVMVEALKRAAATPH
jgi:Protein of unknown function DUF262